MEFNDDKEELTQWQAAVALLKRFKRLTSRELWNKIKEFGLWVPRRGGLTPRATLSANLQKHSLSRGPLTPAQRPVIFDHDENSNEFFLIQDWEEIVRNETPDKLEGIYSIERILSKELKEKDMITRYLEYSRKEVHDIFDPDSLFTPQVGTWGLHEIVNVPNTEDFVFFVSCGRKISGHEFNEYLTEEGVLNWQSQPSQKLNDPIIQKLIHHDEKRNSIHLFFRAKKGDKYTYIGKLKYYSHDETKEQPVHFQWKVIDWNVQDLPTYIFNLLEEKSSLDPSVEIASPVSLLKKNWFIVHYDDSYRLHDNILGFEAEIDEANNKFLIHLDGLPRSRTPYRRLSIGDRFVYYFPKQDSSTESQCIKGIFEITDGPKTYEQDPKNLAEEWQNCVQFRFKPIAVLENDCLPIKPIKENISLFKGKKHWGLEIRGAPNAIREITEEDLIYVLQQIDPSIKFDDIDYEVDLKEKKEKIMESEIDDEEYRLIKTILYDKPQIILYGPPGTGKTYIAREFTKKFVKFKSNFQLIQFHPSYSYEDFVEGISTRVVGGNVVYEPKKKIFRILAEKARDLPNERFVIIIDEINRGDISTIFGELILGLEEEYRGVGISTTYLDEDLVIPPNLFIIGTMNSADHSIKLLDKALRRRFNFLRMDSSEESLTLWLEKNVTDIELGENIITLYQMTRNKILEVKNNDKDSLVGHTYFFKKSREEMEISWQYSIIPLIEDLCNFDEEIISKIHGFFKRVFSNE